MFRVVRSKIASTARFRRFWVPSLDEIEKYARNARLRGGVNSAIGAESITQLIRHVRVGSTNKTSSSARLEMADAALVAQLERLPVGELHFLDVGCSDGSTSLDTIERIEQTLRVPVTAYLMDRYIWIRRLARWHIVEYLSSDDRLVMVRCGCFALAPVPKTFLLAPLTNRLVSAYLGFTSFRAKMRETAKFPLLSPRVLARSDLHIYEGNTLITEKEFIGRMDAVRVSNLLHSDYFSTLEIKKGLSNLSQYVREGGFFVVSRNDEQCDGEIERGTVWRRVGKTLVAVADFGGGSELKPLVASIEAFNSLGAR